MFEQTLANRYAEKFCKEYDTPTIKKRERSFKHTFIHEGKPVTQEFMNGEIMGPVQTWPAQIDDFAYFVSKDHSHRKINYNILKNILLLEHPEITERKYNSTKEYNSTINQMFEAMLIGMKVGKLERIYKRKVEEKERKTFRLIWPLIKEKTKRKSAESLKNLTNLLHQSTPNYFHIRNLTFAPSPELLERQRSY